jgi:DNA-binding NarL/FixJ family response regulator
MLRPHLELLDPDERGEVLEDWPEAESEVGNYHEAIGLVDAARRLYRLRDDRVGQSRTLARAAYYYEWAGERSHAEEHARQAIEVLGPVPEGKDLANALEVSAYLSMMAGDSRTGLDLLDRIFDAAGSQIDEHLLIRCLIHRGGILDDHYPAGLEVCEAAIERARAAGPWQEEARALCNHGWHAVNFRDLTTAETYVKRSMAVHAEHADTDTRGWSYVNTTYAWILELRGEWSLAEDLAREQLEIQGGYVRTFALPIVGIIEARQGRRVAAETLGEAWELATRSHEVQRLIGAAAAAAEYAWISGTEVVPVAELNQVLRRALEVGWPWPSGAIAFWLWHTGNLAEVPKSIAEPYRMMMSGEPIAAAQIWESLHCRYDAAIALSLGDSDAQIQATEVLETLGATAVAAKMRQQLRSRNVPVPRGRSHATRTHPVGLTSRQNEVLHLLAEGLTNLEIADRLFLSPRTVENHVAAVISKLNASSRDSAVAVARDKGLLEATQGATTV